MLVEHHPLNGSEPAIMPIAVAQPELDRRVGPALGEAGEAALDERPVGAVDEFGERPADDLDRGKTGHAQRRARHVKRAPVEREAQDDVLAILAQQSVARFKLLVRLLVAAARGDVGQSRREAQDPARLDLGIKSDFGISACFSIGEIGHLARCTLPAWLVLVPTGCLPHCGRRARSRRASVARSSRRPRCR